jgi:hypothetical protein
VVVESIKDNDLRDRIQDLENSQDSPLLRGALTDYIAEQYPGVAERLSGRHIGVLLEAAAEIDGFEESDESPTDIIRRVIGRAVEHRYPNDRVRDIMGRVDATMGSVAPAARKSGDELIYEAAKPLDSPKLRELRNKRDNLISEYNKYMETANRAAIEYVKREMILCALLERQGYQHDPSKSADDFYHFTDDFKVVTGNETRDRSEAKVKARKEAASNWASWGWQYVRSSDALDRYDEQIDKVEQKIKGEEDKIRNQ